MLKETNHDYHNCIIGNYYDNNCTSKFKLWNEFKNKFAGFTIEGFDDTYHFVFRYDIYKNKDVYTLELCVMLQRKGIYLHLWVENIDDYTLNTEIKFWLKARCKYIKSLWSEILD